MADALTFAGHLPPLPNLIIINQPFSIQIIYIYILYIHIEYDIYQEYTEETEFYDVRDPQCGPASTPLKRANWPSRYCLCEVLDLHQNLARHLAGACAVCHWSFKASARPSQAAAIRVQAAGLACEDICHLYLI